MDEHRRGRAPALRLRRLGTRVAVLFIVAQLVVAGGVVLALPTIRASAPAVVALLALLGADLALVVFVAARLFRDPVSESVERLSSDVLRIADGDYNHRVEDPGRTELRVIRRSVNRLADRAIADQRILAENIRSLEATNRELIQARDQIVRSARLASVGTLAAGIAHEVGNPLGAIIGFVDVARARVERAGGDVELLDSIRAEADRIDRIIRGLLDYARPNAVVGRPMSAGEVVERVHGLLDSQGTLDDVRHEWIVDGATDHVISEPHRLEQVLVNLLLNAAHAVADVDDPRIVVRLDEEEGGLIRMPARREDDPPGINYMHRRRAATAESGIDMVATAERLTVIEVSDNGRGIPEESVEHLFDPFFTTKAPGEGTGLGLAICAQLVEGMGGRIDVTDGVDGGATFVIRLPLSYDMGPSTPSSGHESEESPGP